MSYQIVYWNDQLENFVKTNTINQEILDEIQSFLSNQHDLSIFSSVEHVQLIIRLAQTYQCFEIMLPEELREFFKRYKTIFTSATPQFSSLFFIQWAQFEIKQNRIPKALGILQDALRDEIQPSNLLHQAIQSIYENNALLPTLLQLNEFFRPKPSLESTVSIEGVGKRLDEIFTSLNVAKRNYNSINEPSALNQSTELLDDNYFEKMQKRINSFQETLNNATRTLSNSMIQKAKIGGENQSNSLENIENTTTIKLPSKHELMIATIQRKAKRVSFSPSLLEDDDTKDGSGQHNNHSSRNVIPFPKIKRKPKSDEDVEMANRIITESNDEPEFTSNYSAPTYSTKSTSENSPIVNISGNNDKRVKIVDINGRKLQILQLIGKGGSSKVYKAIGIDFQIYALKRVRLNGLDKSTLEGYMNEIDLLHKLSHNHSIIKLLDTCMDADKSNLHLLMEYGEIDLASMLQEKKRQYPLPTTNTSHLNFVRFFWEQMLRAVSSIHQERIIHCDLKPANFLLVRGTLKLIDFGISKAIQSNETTNVIRENQVGTVNYMAPEALTGPHDSTTSGQLKIGRPSDVWSLGCILYEMVYGVPPFGSFNVIQRIQKIIDSSYNILYPPIQNEHLLQCIKGCLERDQSKRLTMDDLLSHPFVA